MNFYDLCDGISHYITKHINENNSEMIKTFSKENVQFMIRQRKIEDIEFFLTARKSLDALILLDELHFYYKLNAEC